MKLWRKYTQEEMDEKITKSLERTLNYDNTKTIGIPGTKLDDTVFYDGHSFIKHSPYLRTFIQNPNHIGCHTYDKADILFGGTFDIERELIQLLAIDVLNGDDKEFDGYVTQGGTEANIQAMWVYRNYFKKERKAKHEEIAIITSADTHYSAYKGSDLLNIDIIKVPVEFYSRKIQEDTLDSIVKEAKEIGKKYFIVISNMGTTMFGSVDDPDLYANIFDKYNLEYKIHVDGAFGGFIYPINNKECKTDFSNKNVSSITLDGHKMLQAPYGTGVFVCRQNLIHNTLTEEATYIENLDVTISGSRSGANAVAIWMVLASYGPYGWMEKINKLRNRTEWLCEQLDDMGIKYYKENNMNIVTIEEQYVTKEIAEKYFLVPEVHNHMNKWYKIVVMEHVELDILNSLVCDLRKQNKEHLKAI
ncbi:pyridoxal phosphate-dependent decarboxylase family protein [Clostridium sporogenes]|uniref:pyridoxal phosphate-dependent decarboxylase family protein n=1 Tax=Clostridium sporogenes TaxID=1509 RepID=UPI0013D4BB5F|nr:pyridoxal-dependent decarboxylase [Clostridium sporogenes]NFH39396.1 aminotransferase class V-fold PLP-dependent enzyme [Clostridium sporogenes]